MSRLLVAGVARLREAATAGSELLPVRLRIPRNIFQTLHADFEECFFGFNHVFGNLNFRAIGINADFEQAK